MKKFKTLLFVLLIALLTSHKSEYKAPPGTIAISDNLYIDKTEITNVDWREYLAWNLKMYGKNSNQYKLALPDTLVWRNQEKPIEPYVEFYYQHAAFSEYPVVGISYEQALAYCQWRSDRVNEALYLKQNPKPGNEKVPVVFIYRLPSKDEWENAARAGYSNKTQKKIAKGIPSSNLLNQNVSETNSSKNLTYTAPAKSYFPNSLGLYNMIGNVAEMTSEKGIAKGGSWINTPEEVSVTADFIYNEPSIWVGFRCICEKVK